MKINVLARSLVAGAALSAGSLFANAVKIADTTNDGNLNGGEFLVTTSADNSFVTTGDNKSFYSFCLEKTVHISFNTAYTYSISPIAYSGGLDTHSPGVGDPLSLGSAWLYEQFYKGTLVDTDNVGTYFDAGIHSGLAARDYNAGVLQNAFWILEDETTVGAATNFYVQLAIAHFNTLSQNAYADAGATSKVKVLNIWTAPTQANPSGDVQSQLVYVPDGGMTVALLGLGLLSLAAFRRKL